MQDFHRKHNRLKRYDYSSNGDYFVTMCTKERRCLLSEIDGTGTVRLKTFGEIAVAVIKRIPDVFHGTEIDRYVVMPNHIHMIVELSNDKWTLSQVINYLKGNISREIGDHIWQRSFYDHVIRDERDYYRILEYLEMNPRRWAKDKYYME